jgi:hypothetical protein
LAESLAAIREANDPDHRQSWKHETRWR